jgi:hypothetical protein
LSPLPPVYFLALTGAGEVEYKFNIDNSAGFDLLVSEIKFLEITNGDPAADRLKHAICLFHQARHFSYAEEPKPLST